MPGGNTSPQKLGIDKLLMILGEYRFYDSKRAVDAESLHALYRFTQWGRSRSLEDIDLMLENSSLCFCAHFGSVLVS